MVGAVQSGEVRTRDRRSGLHEDVGERVGRIGDHDRLARAGSDLFQSFSEFDVDIDVLLKETGSVGSSQRQTCKEKHNICVTEGIERIRKELDTWMLDKFEKLSYLIHKGKHSPPTPLSELPAFVRNEGYHAKPIRQARVKHGKSRIYPIRSKNGTISLMVNFRKRTYEQATQTISNQSCCSRNDHTKTLHKKNSKI